MDKLLQQQQVQLGDMSYNLDGIARNVPLCLIRGKKQSSLELTLVMDCVLRVLGNQPPADW